MPAGPAPTVELARVTKVFRAPPAPWRFWARREGGSEVVALRDVSLELQAGEMLGLVGPNGAGKTVLVKLIATLTEPSAGTVRVFGRDTVRDSRAIRQRVGLATCDERSFYWRLTAEQNLVFFARLHGFGRRQARQRALELLDRLDLGAARAKTYSVLSAGSRRRLAVARALLADPALLLLDEPTASLDPIAARNLRALLAERLAGDRGRAVLLASHDLAEVEALCARVAFLHRGTLRACGALAELRARFGAVERLVVTVRAPLDRGVVAQLRARAPDLVADNGSAEAVTLRFARQADDERLNQVIAGLVAAGAAIVAVRNEGGALDDLFDRVVGGSETDA
jgi:ABC-2 type transport system ATP-binding protein